MRVMAIHAGPKLRGWHQHASAVALVIVLATAAGCGGSEPKPDYPSGPMAEALADVGGGGEGTTGVGWVDPGLVRESGGDPALMAAALGPNAGSVIEATPRLRARYGLDPLSAERIVSIGGSYAFGIRMDGVDGTRLASALVADGGRARRSGHLRLVEIGDYAVVPDALLDLGVHGVGAFDALGPALSVLAISGRARAALLGKGEPLLEEATYRAAVECLDGVDAARIVADQHLVSTDLGVSLVAVGVEEEDEVICTIGGPPERADEIVEALEAAFAPGARDPITQEPIQQSVAAASVERADHEGVPTVRARLTLRPGQERGYVFGALARATIVGWITGRTQTFGGLGPG
jgi:hypothetical protein